MNVLSPDQRKSFATQLHHNQLLAVLLEEMKNSALTRWSSSKPPQVEDREDCWREYRAVQKLKNMISTEMRREIDGT